MQSIHCKVCARDSIRRFALPEAKYSVLHQQVAAVFGLESNNWVIKYKDEEEMLVTISSDEELAFAAQLMGSLLHMVVVEPSAVKVVVVPPVDNDSQKLEDSHPEERVKNNRVLAHLTKKQVSISARLSVLKNSENPKQRGQVPKLEQKLADVSAQIAELSGAPKKPEEAEAPEPNVPSPLPIVVVPAPSSPAVPKFDMKMMKEASKKFHHLRSNFQKEQKRIQSLVAVVQALKVLSRHGSKAQSPVQVDNEQAQLAQASLVSSKQELSAMKVQLKNQAELIKQLQRQRKEYVRSQKTQQKENCKKKAQKECKPWQKPKNPEEPISSPLEKSNEENNQPEENLKFQADKAQKFAEKAKRQELKAAKLAQKAERQAQRLKWQEEKAARQAEKANSQEEKRQRQFAKKQSLEAVDVPVETVQN
jgi:hypothetical protein